jgi:hypothetical protein
VAKNETDVTNKIMLALSPMGCVLWKNVRGMFLTLDGKRKVRAGIQAPGSSDLIGFKRMEITQEHVGKFLPVLTVIEVKTLTPKTYPSHEQKDFIDFVLEAGGYAGVARCPEDAIKIIQNYFDTK